MKSQTIICGAGIVGVACAYYLGAVHGARNILLIDCGQPLSLTTAKSGENYRDYWPQPWMQEFSSHSISLMHELAAQDDQNGFKLKETGYDFISKTNANLFPDMSTTNASKLYLCTLQRPEFAGHRAYLADSIQQIVHIPRAGMMDVHVLGSLMLNTAKRAGVKFATANVTEIKTLKNGGYQLRCKNSEALECEQLVLAAGPFSAYLAKALGIDLPLQNFLQHKFLIADPAKVIPHDMPFTIIADPQYLSWSDDEKQLFEDELDYRYLLNEFPAGLHIKPEGRNNIKLGWAYNRLAEEPHFNPGTPEEFVDIVLRGASQYVPALSQYIGKTSPITKYSGYYTRTAENLPLYRAVRRFKPLSGNRLIGIWNYDRLCNWRIDCERHTGRRLTWIHEISRAEPIYKQKIMAEIAAYSNDGQL